jgi:hypothetical protein
MLKLLVPKGLVTWPTPPEFLPLPAVMTGPWPGLARVPIAFPGPLFSPLTAAYSGLIHRLNGR